MGARTIQFIYPGNLTLAEVRAKFAEQQQADLHEFGSDPYSGSSATIIQVDYDPHVYSTVHNAVDALTVKTAKRHATITKARKKTEGFSTTPTFNGRPVDKFKIQCDLWTRPLFVFDYSTTGPRGYDRKIVYADQLTPDEARGLEILRTLVNNQSITLEDKNLAYHNFEEILRHSSVDCALPSFNQWNDLETAYEALRQATRDYHESHKEMEAYSLPLKERLYTKHTIDEGQVWIVLGIAAE